jgi:hypothetical protein
MITEYEIEVTDEMYRAGASAAEAFYLGDGVYYLSKCCLTAMYRAMDVVRYGGVPVESQSGEVTPQCESSVLEVFR